MRKTILWGILVSMLGCGPRNQVEDQVPANPLRATSLVETYRDFPERARELYTGQVVVVRVLRGHYDKSGDRELHWYSTGNRTKPPAIVFVCRGHHPEVDGEFDLLVTGRCLGRIVDGHDRGNDVRFMLRFFDCSVTRLETNP